MRMISEEECRRRVEIARRITRDETTSELAADLRALAGEFAREVRALRCELRSRG